MNRRNVLKSLLAFAVVPFMGRRAPIVHSNVEGTDFVYIDTFDLTPDRLAEFQALGFHMLGGRRDS